MKKFVDVAIVAGQGIFQKSGSHYNHRSEYPEDQKIYLKHADWSWRFIRDIAKKKNIIVVTSGSYTRPEDSTQSEAESFLPVWAEKGPWPGKVPIILDDLALDSAENMYCPLMAVRLALNGVLTPIMGYSIDTEGCRLSSLSTSAAHSYKDTANTVIDTVHILTAWKFKQLRFSLAADALGINPYYIHGTAEAHEAQNPSLAVRGEAGVISKMTTDNDYLMRDGKWRNKKTGRYQKPRFGQRFGALRKCFPATFDSLENTACDQLQKRFNDEVLKR